MGKKAGQRRRSMPQQRPNLTLYETESGETIRVKPVSNLAITMIRLRVRDEFREDGEPIDVPTYSTETVAGDVQTFDLDEASIEVPDDAEETARRKALWDAYQDATYRMMAEANKRVLKYVYSEGVLAEVPDGWVEEMREYGIPIPDSPKEQKTYYVMLRLAPTQREQLALSARIVRLSVQGRVDDTLLEAAEATFRSGLGADVREGDSGSETDDSAESVVA